MTWLQRVFRLDRSAREFDVDPDAVVWVATVAFWQAPLVVHALGEQQIDARFAESAGRRSTVGGFPSARIYVKQRHRAAAERIILEVTDTGSAGS